MEEKSINILLIEDNQDDAELLQRKLSNSANGRFKVTPANCLKDGLEKLSGNTHDLILSDLGLPDSHGLDTVTQVLQMAPETPLVVLSGYDNEETAIKAVQLGAQDYIVKGQLDGTQMERSLFYAIERSLLQREVEHYADEISKIHTNLVKILDKNADAIIVVSQKQRVLFINPAAESLFQKKKKELLNTSFKYPVEGGITSEIDVFGKDGGNTVAEMRVVDIDWEGQPAYLASVRDITERRQAEIIIQQQKEFLTNTLESITHPFYVVNANDYTIEMANEASKTDGISKANTCYSMTHKSRGPCSGKDHVCPLEEVKKKKKPIIVEHLHATDKGAKRNIEVHGYPLFDAEGNVTQMIEYCLDITERKQVEEKLRESEERLKKYLDSAPDGVYISDTKGTLIYGNKKAEDLTGYKREELIGSSFLKNNILPAKYLAKAGKLLAMSVLGKPTGPDEFELNRKDGSHIWLEITSTPVKQEGKLQIIGFVRDITERRKTEKALRESEEKFSKAFRSSPDVIVISTVKEGKFIDINDSFTNITGYTREEVINRTSEDIGIWVSPQDRLSMIELLEKKGEVKQQEYEFRMKSGQKCVWLFSAERMKFGNEDCVISISIDITERKKTVEALRFSDAAFKSIHESVIATDTDYKITHWNEISEQIYGIKASEAIGKKILDTIEIVEKYPGENQDHLTKIENTGYLHEEQLHRTRHGEVWVDVSFQGIEGNGKRYGWVILASAITQRKLAEEAMKRSEEKYRELINTSIDGIISIDQNMRIIIWNQGAERIFGYNEKEILGKSILILTSEKQKHAAKKILTQMIKTQDDANINRITEQELHKKDGTAVPIELSLSKRKVEDTFLVTGIFRDITERKLAEEKLKQLDQMKSEFLSNVSHEIRTPLQSIGGFAKLILEGKVPDVKTQQEFLQIINRETQQLGVLINSLLDMSRLESGRFQINKRCLPVRDTFVDSIKIFHSLARDKDVSLDEYIPAVLPEIEVDGERLRQVVVNLLSNAIKFSDPGGKVTARVKTRNKELLFQVKDRGIGINKKAMSHLFERFYRAEDKLARGGTGLGLFISKQIIEAHGGQIWAESKVGEGSTFTFTLPLNGKGGNGNGKKNTDN